MVALHQFCSARPFVKLRDIINEGMASGEMRPTDPWVAASCTFGPALRMITLRLDGVFPGDLTGCTETIWDATWRAIRAPEG